MNRAATATGEMAVFKRFMLNLLVGPRVSEDGQAFTTGTGWKTPPAQQ
jgi:hypothetical protein